MLNDNKQYYYNDHLMYFNFDNVYSKEYNLFIVNGGDDLKIINNPNATTEFSSPMYQNSSYLLGTNKSQKEFSYKCAAEGITLPKYKEMMKWLNIGNVGFLVTDIDIYWGYDVVLESISESIVTYLPFEKMIVEFEIKFKTIGDWCAKALFNSYSNINNTPFDISTEELEEDEQSRLEQTSINEYGIPEINYIENVNNSKKIRIQSVSNEHSYINYTYKPNLPGNTEDKTGKFILKNKNIPYAEYTLNFKEYAEINFYINYLGEYSFVLKNNSELVENTNLATSSIQNNGILALESKTPRLIVPIEITSVGDKYKLELSQEDYNLFDWNNDTYMCISYSLKKKLNFSKYNTNVYNSGKNINLYPFVYQNILVYKEDVVLQEISNRYFIEFSYNPKQRQLTLEQIRESNIYVGNYNELLITDSNSSDSSITVIKHNNL